MKKLLLFISGLILVSCSKNDDLELRPVPAAASIVGLWEVDESVNTIYYNGALYSNDSSIVQPREERLLVRNDNTFEGFHNDYPEYSGTYIYDGTNIVFIEGTDSTTHSVTLNPTGLILKIVESSNSGTDFWTYVIKSKMHKI